MNIDEKLQFITINANGDGLPEPTIAYLKQLIREVLDEVKPEREMGDDVGRLEVRS